MKTEGQRLTLSSAMPYSEKKLAVETAMMQGFFSVGTKFPVVLVGERSNTVSLWETLCQDARERLKQRPAPEGYRSALPEAKPVPDFDFRKERGLESLFSDGEFLQDRDGDLLPDAICFKICLPEDADVWTTAAACTLAYRMGMEVTAYEGPVVAPEETVGSKIVFRDSGVCRMDLHQTPTGAAIAVQGRGRELLAFVSRFCETFPQAGKQRGWADVLQDMTEDFALRGVNGQLACGAALAQKTGTPVSVFGTEDLPVEVAERLYLLHPGVRFTNGRKKKKVYQRTYTPEWEVDHLLRLLRQQVFPRIQPGDQVRISAALSEDKTVRRDLEQRISAELTQRGAGAECTLLCAYKQGFSWIDEWVLPRAEQRKAKKIILRFRPFLPPGETVWHDENGATPSYLNLGADNPDHWYDLPIRYLQELYPIEDVIARRLGISKDAIALEAYQGSANLTYEWTAFDGDGAVVQQETYRACCSEIPYLDDYPAAGKVHPPTGFLKVWVNGAALLDERIPTDTERVWAIYQREVLPECRAYVEQKTGGAPSAASQPFFTQLRLEVQLSEPDESLESRQDLFSSLDALHEDLYFVGSDYFKNYGIHRAGEVFDAPGLILPLISKRDGPPLLRVTLYEPLCPQPCVCQESSVLQSLRPREELSCLIDRVSWADGQLIPRIRTEGVPPETAAAYARLWNEDILQFPEDAALGAPVWYAGGTEFPGVPRAPRRAEPLPIEQIHLPQERVIGYEQYLGIIRQLERVEGLSVYQTAVSYQGRKIYAVELTPRAEGYVSRTKRLTMRPSEIINCRHHANEVSSTNAAFALIRELLTNPKYRELPEKLNLVIVPLENVDGAAIHYQLQKEHPRWKFHVARFNSVGKEFYHDHFLPDTIHTEARSFRRLWRAFLPDAVVDDHGVPTHEWEQPFSGYTSPSYKGFWLPRSLLYGYYWTVNGDAFAGNFRLNKQLENAVADAVEQDGEMCRWNQAWMREFETYAHQWMPRLFPADYYRGMIDYWIPFDYSAQHRYPSIRFPWITSVAYTSEVADETAQGDYLRLCAHAHTVHDLAMIDALADAGCVWQTGCSIGADAVSLRMIRQRPIIIKEKN